MSAILQKVNNLSTSSADDLFDVDDGIMLDVLPADMPPPPGPAGPVSDGLFCIPLRKKTVVGSGTLPSPRQAAQTLDFKRQRVTASSPLLHIDGDAELKLGSAPVIEPLQFAQTLPPAVDTSAAASAASASSSTSSTSSSSSSSAAQPTSTGKDAVDSFAVISYAGHSKKGYAPYNPRKKNQDALLMMEDAASRSLLLACFDGHGEFGHKISQTFKKEVGARLFEHPAFRTDVRAAITDLVAAVEQELLQNVGIDTNFSGTTMVLAIIRGYGVVAVCDVGFLAFLITYPTLLRPSFSSSRLAGTS